MWKLPAKLVNLKGWIISSFVKTVLDALEVIQIWADLTWLFSDFWVCVDPCFILNSTPNLFITFFTLVMQDAVRWFLNTWTTSCKHLVNPGTLASCKRLQWEQQWELAKDALENVSGRGASLNREWWHLVNLWADLGYQYIPFQPGPTVYFSGVTDPSLIALFESVANNTLQLNQTIRSTKSYETFPRSNESSNAYMRSFFTCMKSHIGELPTQALISGHPCWEDFLKVYMAADGSTRALLVGKISAGLRCLEVLSLFPTTIEEDRVLISNRSSSHTYVNGMPCSGKQTVSDHLQLTRQYRYLKKLMLQDVVNKLTSWFHGLTFSHTPVFWVELALGWGLGFLSVHPCTACYPLASVESKVSIYFPMPFSTLIAGCHLFSNVFFSHDCKLPSVVGMGGLTLYIPRIPIWDADCEILAIVSDRLGIRFYVMEETSCTSYN